jgi:copper chaperone NosL
MKNNIKPGIRWTLLLAGCALAAVIFLPIWRIELSAPQYPEGLKLQIFADKLGGNVDIINGLNHYIGMKTLHANDFIEFTVLKCIIIFFAAAFALCAAANKKKGLYILFFAFVAFGIVAMVDFWRWEYNYGHDLSPDAAIIVPGMAYQPPLIGYKQLLNFGAYSIPDIGGWIFVGVGVLLLVAVVAQIKNSKALAKRFKPVKQVAVLTILFSFLASCNPATEPIVIGKDNCASCKMTFTDVRFGGEILTKKGRVYKFDDTHCLVSFLKSNQVDSNTIKEIYLVDFTGSHSLLPAASAKLLNSSALRTPMNGNIAAFASVDSFSACIKNYGGEEVKWNDIKQ